jgi:hypothetical protein
MSLDFQTVFVTLAMLSAVAIVVRRVFVSSKESIDSCPSCESGGCAPKATRPSEPEVRPLQLVRPKR